MKVDIQQTKNKTTNSVRLQHDDTHLHAYLSYCCSVIMPAAPATCHSPLPCNRHHQLLIIHSILGPELILCPVQIAVGYAHLYIACHNVYHGETSGHTRSTGSPTLLHACVYSRCKRCHWQHCMHVLYWILIPTPNPEPRTPNPDQCLQRHAIIPLKCHILRKF